MRLAVLTQDPHGPVTRHRVRAIDAHLRAAGIESVVHAIPKRVRERVTLFRSLHDADVVLLQRKLFTAAELTLLRRASRRLVYDFDDAVMHRDPFRRRMRSYVRARRFRAVVHAADLVLAGNEYLAGLAEDAGPTPVVVAPTPIDTTRYLPGPPRPPQGFRVGWIGSRSTRPYLRLIDGVLARAAGEIDGFVFAVMADRAPELSVPVEFTPWSEAAEVPFLQSLDAGVMPLTDDAWSRGKCGFKMLQYMSCGVAAVVSAVGVNVEIGRNGVTAAVVGDDDAWLRVFHELAADRRPAHAWREGARSHVEHTYSTAVLGPEFAAALHDVAVREAAS